MLSNYCLISSYKPFKLVKNDIKYAYWFPGSI